MSATSANAERGLRLLWQKMVGPARNAVAHHWMPLLFIQVAAVLLVVAYFQSAAVRSALVSVETAKTHGGLIFAFLVGATAGGAIPEIAKVLTGRLKRSTLVEWLKLTSFNALVYGLVGIEVDLFYSGQSVLFGDGRDVLTLAKKTALDMFVFSPTIAIPTAVIFYALRRRRFQGLGQPFGTFYADQVLPSMLLCWIFWIPVLFCVYSMPANLQFPFSNLAEAAWSMVFVFFNTESHD